MTSTRKTPEEACFWNMLQRCENPNNPRFDCYGGRGIQVCERWHDLACFLEDMGPRPSGKLSIHRIDNDGDYTPSNCKWATIEEQIENRRPRRKDPNSLSAIARSNGVNYETLRRHIVNGMTVDEALTDLAHPKVPLQMVADALGVTRQRVHQRLRYQHNLDWAEAVELVLKAQEGRDTARRLVDTQQQYSTEEVH